MPEKQDVVTIRDKNRNWKEQKRILTITIAEVHQLLKNKHPDVTIGKSRFSSLLPNGRKIIISTAEKCMQLHLPQ